MLMAPFSFLDWIACRISSTAGHKGLPVRDSLSWLSQLIKTSVSRKIKLNSAIIGLAQSADNFSAALSFSQSGFELSRQGFDDIHWLSSLRFPKEWFKRSYRFLKRWAHDFPLLLTKDITIVSNYNIKVFVCQGNLIKETLPPGTVIGKGKALGSLGEDKEVGVIEVLVMLK